METLEKYLDERKTGIISILEQSRHAYTQETFHKLRVEIKKLNALFDLISFCSKDFKRKKTFKPFHKIFRQAGKVRELQVEESILEHYSIDSPLSDYRKQLELQKVKQELNFFLIMKKKLLKELKRKFKVIDSFISDVKKKKVKAYMTKMDNKISKPFSKKTIPPKQIHKLRKLMKLLIYNTDALYDEKEESFAERKAVAELLGNWHDLRVIIRHFDKTEGSKGMNPEEINQLESIRTEIKWESELLFSEINLAIPKSESEILP